MLSPRYHLVSIVAIFLALGLGLLAGSSFGQPALVGQLQERTDAQLRRIEELRAEVEVERARADALAAYARASAPLLIAGRLAEVPVVVVTQEGVSPGLEGSVLDALAGAGAEVLATFAAQPSLAPGGPADEAALSALLGAGSADGGTPYPVRAGARMAERLATTLPPVDREIDVLAAFVDDGFLAPREGALDEATRLAIRSPGLLVVVLGGGPDGGPTATAAFAEALVRGLGEAGVVVGAVEPSAPAQQWIDGLPVGPVVAVTGGEQPSGAVALVLGLARAIATGDGGAFGGEDSPLPEVP